MRQGKSRFGALDLGSEIFVLWKVHNSLRKFGHVSYCVLCFWLNFWALDLEDFYFFCSSISLFVSGNAVHPFKLHFSKVFGCNKKVVRRYLIAAGI